MIFAGKEFVIRAWELLLKEWMGSRARAVVVRRGPVPGTPVQAQPLSRTHQAQLWERRREHVDPSARCKTHHRRLFSAQLVVGCCEVVDLGRGRSQSGVLQGILTGEATPGLTGFAGKSAVVCGKGRLM